MTFIHTDDVNNVEKKIEENQIYEALSWEKKINGNSDA